MAGPQSRRQQTLTGQTLSLFLYRCCVGFAAGRRQCAVACLTARLPISSPIVDTVYNWQHCASGWVVRFPLVPAAAASASAAAPFPLLALCCRLPCSPLLLLFLVQFAPGQNIYAKESARVFLPQTPFDRFARSTPSRASTHTHEPHPWSVLFVQPVTQKTERKNKRKKNTASVYREKIFSPSTHIHTT